MSVLNIVLFCAVGFLLGIVISWLVSNIASRIRNRTARRRVEPQATGKKHQNDGLDSGHHRCIACLVHTPYAHAVRNDRRYAANAIARPAYSIRKGSAWFRSSPKTHRG